MHAQALEIRSERMVEAHHRRCALILTLGIALAPACHRGSASQDARGQEPKTAPAADPLAPPSDLLVPPPNAERTPTGLRSVVLRRGNGTRRPASYDRVSIEYTGWTERGAVFATTRSRGAPAVLRVDDVVPGWSEGLRLMVAGERRRLWIPAVLAYAGKPGQPAGALVMDIELLAVAEGTPPLPPPADLAAPPVSAERTPSGIAHVLLEPAQRDKRAELYDRVRISYVGWSANGTMIDSSQTQGGAVEVSLARGFPGWREALQLLREGEKRRFWFPPKLAYEAYPGVAAGTLVYEIELLRVIDMPAPPPAPRDLSAPPKNALRTSSGVVYRVLIAGRGSHKPSAESGVDVHHTCWTQDGRMMDSTIPTGRPQRADLEDGDLPAGLDEAVQQMTVGEKRRLWIPQALGYATKGAPASGTQVCDFELIAVYEHGVKLESTEPLVGATQK
jgi:FKBP-type peptidyl-prolyl cis-trans isomerase